MSQNEHAIKVLNELIAATIDSIEGYQDAAQDTEGPGLGELFQSWANDRQYVVGHLQQAVVTLGGEPHTKGTTLASVHRVFTDLRAALSHGDKAVVDAAERGEDHMKAKFEGALEDRKLSPEVLLAIKTAFMSVKQGHDEMRELKYGTAR